MSTTCFLPSFQASATASVFLSTESQEEEHESVRICIIGSKRGIRAIIQNLHRRGFAEANDWGKPQPTGNGGEFISVLVRRIVF